MVTVWHVLTVFLCMSDTFQCTDNIFFIEEQVYYSVLQSPHFINFIVINRVLRILPMRTVYCELIALLHF